MPCNKNKISRAIQGNNVRKTKPDIHFIEDVQKNDYLFLCSDGVSGSIDDTELCGILSTVETLQEKMQIINTLGEANSSDNYSAYLIQIDSVESPKQITKTDTNGFFYSIKSKTSKFIKKYISN